MTSFHYWFCTKHFRYVHSLCEHWVTENTYHERHFVTSNKIILNLLHWAHSHFIWKMLIIVILLFFSCVLLRWPKCRNKKLIFILCMATLDICVLTNDDLSAIKVIAAHASLRRAATFMRRKHTHESDSNLSIYRWWAEILSLEYENNSRTCINWGFEW